MSTVEFYYDRRLYGIDQAEWGDPSDCDMRIPDDLLKSVVFLCKKSNSEKKKYDFLATAFLFSVPIDKHPLLQCVYFVTAKHVIEKAINRGYDLHARVNKRNGDAEFLPLPKEWVYVADSGSDVAVYSFPFDNQGDQYECKPIAAACVLTPTDRVAHGVIGIGEIVFTVGLFSDREGKRRNIPIIRVGNIAAVPSEPLNDEESGLEYHAYLMDIISTPGLSGSPVFAFFQPALSQEVVSIHPVTQVPSVVGPSFARIMGAGARIYLLGIIRSHWEIDKQNMGIAMVTPIEELMILINDDPRLQQLKRQTVNQDLREHAPVLDTKRN